MATVAMTFPAAGSLIAITAMSHTEIRARLREVDREAARAIAQASDRITLHDDALLRADLHHFVLVFDVHEDVALAIYLREFGLAAESHRSGDCGACFRVDDREVTALTVKGEDTMRHRLINDGVRILTGVDLADHFERGDVEEL